MIADTDPMIPVDRARNAIGLPPLGGMRGAMLIDSRLLPQGRPYRPRGVYVRSTEAQALIELCGWQVMDVCPGVDECLLLPPAACEAVA